MTLAEGPAEEEYEDAGNPWYYDIKNYQKDKFIPDFATPQQRRALRDLSRRFVMLGDVLYKRSFDGVLIRCNTREEGYFVIQEAHSGICGGHVNSQMLAKKMLRQGYYWPTMERDC